MKRSSMYLADPGYGPCAASFFSARDMGRGCQLATRVAGCQGGDWGFSSYSCFCQCGA